MNPYMNPYANPYVDPNMNPFMNPHMNPDMTFNVIPSDSASRDSTRGYGTRGYSTTSDNNPGNSNQRSTFSISKASQQRLLPIIPNPQNTAPSDEEAEQSDAQPKMSSNSSLQHAESPSQSPTEDRIPSVEAYHYLKHRHEFVNMRACFFGIIKVHFFSLEHKCFLQLKQYGRMIYNYVASSLDIADIEKPKAIFEAMNWRTIPIFIDYTPRYGYFLIPPQTSALPLQFIAHLMGRLDARWALVGMTGGTYNTGGLILCGQLSFSEFDSLRHGQYPDSLAYYGECDMSYPRTSIAGYLDMDIDCKPEPCIGVGEDGTGVLDSLPSRSDRRRDEPRLWIKEWEIVRLKDEVEILVAMKMQDEDEEGEEEEEEEGEEMGEEEKVGKGKQKEQRQMSNFINALKGLSSSIDGQQGGDKKRTR